MTPEDQKRKHHIAVVEDEIMKHGEKYPGLPPISPKHSPEEIEEEVKKFDELYELPKKPAPHIRPSL